MKTFDCPAATNTIAGPACRVIRGQAGRPKKCTDCKIGEEVDIYLGFCLFCGEQKEKLNNDGVCKTCVELHGGATMGDEEKCECGVVATKQKWGKRPAMCHKCFKARETRTVPAKRKRKKRFLEHKNFLNHAPPPPPPPSPQPSPLKGEGAEATGTDTVTMRSDDARLLVRHFMETVDGNRVDHDFLIRQCKTLASISPSA